MVTIATVSGILVVSCLCWLMAAPVVAWLEVVQQDKDGPRRFAR